MIEYFQPLRIYCTARWRAWPATMLAIGISCDAFAGIGTDSSLGRPAQALAGPHYLIPETLGKLSGNNLFHSFQTFNISAGESANFTTATPSIANVISRVTGGSLSQINGQLSLTPCGGCGAPNFFFINPAGIAFGAGASVDVPGAFHVSTADYIKFPDGNFHAGPGQASTFSSAPPEAFGFLGMSRASIAINGGVELSTKPSQAISIVAGDIEINQGAVYTLGGGDIRVVALGQRIQEVGFKGALPAAGGNFSTLDGGYISSGAGSATDGGSIKVGAGNIIIDGGCCISGLASAANAGAGNAGSIEVTATENISVVNGGYIYSSTQSSGAAGNVEVSAYRIVLDGQGYQGSIVSGALAGSTGRTGNVAVSATGEVSLVNGGSVSATTYSSGDAGAVRVNASSITIDDQGSDFATGIFSDAAPGSGGKAGTIEVLTTAALSVINGGRVSSGTWASGDAGFIRIDAGEVDVAANGLIFAGSSGRGSGGVVSVETAGLTIRQDGQISAQATSGGRGGAIQLQVDTLDLSDGGTISNRTYNYQREAGDISVSASKSIRITGRAEGQTSSPGSDEVSTGILSFAGNIFVSTPELALLDSGGISTRTWNDLNSGNLTVETGRLTLLNGGNLSADAFGHSGYLGSAGNVSVTAHESILISGMATAGERNRHSIISSGTRSSGGAGIITLTTPSLRVAEDALISTSTGVFGEGGAGEIVIRADTVEVVSGGAITSLSNGYGGGGNITVNTNSLLLNHGQIVAFGDNTGVAGNIALYARDIAMTGGAVNTESQGHSKAGNIQVVTGQLSLGEGSSINSNSYDDGDAGNIYVSASGRVSVLDSTMTTAANYGNGGSITLQSDNIVILGNSQITTSVFGTTGNGGNIGISAGALVLSTGFIQANTAAKNASGGLVGIDVQMLVPSGNTLFLGGDTSYSYQPGVFGFNVIQAAAPTGVSGTVQIASPVLDISGSLIGFNTPMIDAGGLGRSPCQISGGSSLAQSGRGGLPPSARGLLRAEPDLPHINSHIHASASADFMHVALANGGCV